jgi:hypothetical protein
MRKFVFALLLAVGSTVVAEDRARQPIATIQPLEAEADSLDAVIVQIQRLQAKAKRILSEAAAVHSLNSNVVLDYDPERRLFLVYPVTSK